MRALILVMFLTGCSTIENYQFGDITRAALSVKSKLSAMKATYCNEVNEEARDVLLSLIQHREPEYRGVCEQH